MEKKLCLKVKKDDEGMPLGRFLRVRGGLSQKEISRAKFMEQGICVNKERRKVTALLSEGDEVEVCLGSEEESSPLLSAFPEEVLVLYEDEDVLVLNKPSGLNVHPAGKRGREGDTLASRLAYYLRQKNEDTVIRMVGRLDKDTSGAVLAARNRAAALRLARQREQGVFYKTYLALAAGVPESSQGTVCAPLAPCPEDRIRMCVQETGKRAVTHFKVLKTYRALRKIEGKTELSKPLSLIRVGIDTGRMHQIRVHMAYLGCPLLGDPLYGNAESIREGRRLGIERTALHARELTFFQPFTGEKIAVTAPLPKDIAGILDSVIE